MSSSAELPPSKLGAHEAVGERQRSQDVATVGDGMSPSPDEGVVAMSLRSQRQIADRMTQLHFVTASLSEVLTPDEVAAVVVGAGRAALKASGGYI
ncbi:MAG TPA: hypothetical protein VGW38_00400, partial [Chloroflexota bacterium]|nr:hypothetical protein [Chloroflexota bacterium]